jgi:cold shock CspA family protein
MTDTGTVAWFDLTKQFGFVALSSGGDAFLHMTVLKEAGYVWIPRGTTLRVRSRRIAASRGWPKCLRSIPAPPAPVRMSLSSRPERDSWLRLTIIWQNTAPPMPLQRGLFAIRSKQDQLIVDWHAARSWPSVSNDPDCWLCKRARVPLICSSRHLI